MTLAALILAGAAVLLAGGLAVALVRQQDRQNAYTAQLLGAFREERAQLINKIDPHSRPIPTGRTVTKPQRRSQENVKDYARVGTVSPPRDPSSNGDEG